MVSLKVKTIPRRAEVPKAGETMVRRLPWPDLRVCVLCVGFGENVIREQIARGSESAGEETS